MKKAVYPVLFLVLYLVILFPFVSYMKNKPYVEKLGYVPSGVVMKYITADQKELVAATLVMKVLFYFGGLVDRTFNRLNLPIDYPAMSRQIHAAVKLDPYNLDAYYFAQATLVWDVGQIKIANDLLDYGMKYRTWDYFLPFSAGFNYAYFLKDYGKAAVYYRKAADLSGSELTISLTGRYLYESGKSEAAIAYLTAMEQGTRNDAIRKTFLIRIKALKEGRRIEQARGRYIRDTGRIPSSVEELVRKDYLIPPPEDPYGGKFYFETDGSVRSTSKFAFGTRKERE